MGVLKLVHNNTVTQLWGYCKVYTNNYVSIEIILTVLQNLNLKFKSRT